MILVLLIAIFFIICIFLILSFTILSQLDLGYYFLCIFFKKMLIFIYFYLLTFSYWTLSF